MGKQVVGYNRDPETGELTPVTAPTKPGQWARDLIIGALVAGADASEAPRRSGALGGLLIGRAAGLENKLGRKDRRVAGLKQKAQEHTEAAVAKFSRRS